VEFTKQEFSEEVVRRYLPHSRLSSGLLVVDESTYETIKQKFVSRVLYEPWLFSSVYRTIKKCTIFSLADFCN